VKGEEEVRMDAAPLLKSEQLRLKKEKLLKIQKLLGFNFF
jgi:hypothetical protein